MDQSVLPNPSPSPVAGPIFPNLPTTTQKNITRVIVTLSAILVGIGGWYANEVETDPDTAQVIATKINVPGLVTAGTGILGIVLGLFQQKQHTDQAEVAVVKAAVSPPIDANGNQSYEHTLNAALTQAAQSRRYVEATKILALIQAIGSGSGHGALPYPDDEEVQ